MKKRIISVALIFAVMFTMMPLNKFTSVFALSNAEALTPFTYQTGKYYILASSLNVRSGPSTSFNKITSVAQDTAVTVRDVKDGWGQIIVNGKTGWMDLSYAYSDANKFDIEARLDMLRLKFPDGTYWNREDPEINNADGYTENPCQNKHSDKRENYFDGTCQCHGFALKLGYDLFGIHAGNWQRHYDLNQVKVGDLIRYRSRHTVMIVGVYADYFTVADCNWDYCCGIDWDRTMNISKFSFTEDKYDGIYHCPSNGGYVKPSDSSTVTTQPSTTQSTTSPSKTTTKATTTTSKTSTTQSKGEVYTTGKVKITGDVVNVRLGAGTNYFKIGTVKQNSVYTYTKDKSVNGEKWYYIKMNFLVSGWVCGKYCKVTQQLGAPIKTTAPSTTTTTSRTTTTSNTTTTISTTAKTTTTKATTTAAVVNKIKVTGDVVNVRAGAGTNYKKVTQVKRNSVYKYTQKKTVNGVVWYKINVTSSKSGWICGQYCKVV